VPLQCVDLVARNGIAVAGGSWECLKLIFFEDVAVSSAHAFGLCVERRLQ
jgi:hypothetical protein